MDTYTGKEVWRIELSEKEDFKDPTMQQVVKKMKQSFTCDREDPDTGEPCNLGFPRRWNLNRHIGRRHGMKPNDPFVNYVPGEGGVEKGKETEAAHPAQSPVTVTLAAKTLFPTDNSQQRTTTNSNTLEATTATLPPLVGIDSLGPNTPSPDAGAAKARAALTTLAASWGYLITPLGDFSIRLDEHTGDATSGFGDELVRHDQVHHWSEPRIGTSARGWEERKRQKNCKRLCDCDGKDNLPVYEVKRSRKWPRQQRALWWLSEQAKDRFDLRFSGILASWGLSASHKGTCVLVAADWAALSPIQIIGLFEPSKCLSPWADGVVYQYSDHTTNLTRAIAWFDDESWPRNGIELDNFTGCGPFKPKHGSHLCNHQICLIHIVYESAQINQERKECHQKARFLRQGGWVVPERCDEHQPGCLMQHAALTTLETILIQIHVLCLAKGLPVPAAPHRPRWHVYPTFESQLPLKFCAGNSAVMVAPRDLVTAVIPDDHEGRPDLICPFCRGIKAFQSIVALWSHFVHWHDAATDEMSTKVVVDRARLLEEVRRTADLWRAYWAEHSISGKKRDPTLMKLNQVATEEFSWATVLSWDLR